MTIILELPFFASTANKDLPALAGTVQGVVVHMAKHKSGKNSSNNGPEVGGALTTLNMA